MCHSISNAVGVEHHHFSRLCQLAFRRGGPDTALSVWVAELQEGVEDRLIWQFLLFLRHPDAHSGVWVTPAKQSFGDMRSQTEFGTE